MKIYPIIKHIISLGLFALIITNEACSQQVIKFKDGTEIKAFITYQSQDTVKYYLESQPQVVYVETMNHIDRISPVKQLPVFPPDSLARPYNEKKYLHYKHMTIQGSILLPLGAVFTGLGIAIFVSNDEASPADIGRALGTLNTVIGAVGILSGIICVTVGTTNMQKYKEKMHGFSFDLKCTPQVKGISLTYRF
jgi:hypothetical protein